MATIEYATEGHRAVITINRPEARNAVNADVAAGIEEAIDRLEADDSLWVGILTGVPPVFCAGADLKEINAGRLASLSTPRGGFGGITRRKRTKPIVAAVDGAALAGGTEIALSCDLIVASANATFGIPEVKRSLVAAAGGLFRLPRNLPFNVAMELALTGDPIDADPGPPLRSGQRPVPSRARPSRRPGSWPPASKPTLRWRCAASRHVVMAAITDDEDAGWRLSAEAMARAMGSQDSKEGLMAFIEKRPPRWTGK